MGIALWVVQVLLAAALLVFGATKLSQPKEKLVKNLAWVEGLISRFVKSFEVGEGVAEVTTERSTPAQCHRRPGLWRLMGESQI